MRNLNRVAACGRKWARVSRTIAMVVVYGSAVVVAGCGSAPNPTRIAGTRSPLARHVARFVNPFIGTTGGGNTFPGADYPFGMVQWSPDTVPLGNATPGGYNYGDHRVKGFSLTHLSGAGCFAFGTPSVLPLSHRLRIGVAVDAANLVPAFSHGNERAHPGYYSVRLKSGIVQALSVTRRTGIARTSYPRHVAPGMMIFAGSSSSGGFGHIGVVGTRVIAGWSQTGQFCNHGLPESNRVYFAATFSRPFAHVDVTDGQGNLEAGRVTTGPKAAVYVRFGSSPQTSVVTRIGISFVSISEARKNLEGEDQGLSFRRLRSEATTAWNAMLGLVKVSGGPRPRIRSFYTALYHSLLYPDVVDDDDGTYLGFDGKVHSDGGVSQFGNFSLWDIYRSQIPLLSLIAPTQTNEMIESLVRDGQQTGSLPRWSQAGGETGVMVGDPADPAIANAYAFGARGFNIRSALSLMIKGAQTSRREQNGYLERPHLNAYLRLGYVPAPGYGSVAITLEYATDDFAISRLLRALGDSGKAAQFASRSQNWRRLFDPSTGMIEPRLANGQFALGSQAGPSPFVEGTAEQYTWLVPQDLARLFAVMGGKHAAIARLKAFFGSLNGGSLSNEEWIGNEPGFGAPWEFDWLGKPGMTRVVVRKIVRTEFSPGPAGLPGNDDLGAISSWYVWACLGLYPEIPGLPGFAIAGPTFRDVTLELPGGAELRIIRRRAATHQSVALLPEVNGQPVRRAWVPWSYLSHGATVALLSNTRQRTAIK